MESSTFRFLDLSPELRNQVYAHGSNEFVIAYKTSRDCRFDLERNSVVQVLCNLLRPFEVDWESTPAHHQLGLPWSSRQLYIESSRQHFENTVINFDFCHRDSSLPRLTKFIDAFRDKLQFVRKLSMPLTVAETMLIGFTLHEPIISAAVKNELLRIRGYLPNVQQVYVFPDPDISAFLDHAGYPFHHQALSFVVMYHLADPKVCQALSNTFPRLTDITTTNEFGSERFRQVGGQWQRWYSREIIPAQRRRARLLRFAPVAGGELFDCLTSLTTQYTLQWIRA
ncbi:hypothetical protein PRZ48_012895 [Zasmidium cellare]|uniref:Uncharacterized protein n=1 Tax=Zasmidium cellare TaxID=395010 RepID=A0ABR0E2I7_ZASCE|nr:hypothetical protein PRZ48_012895 [Zasmidium cellare]